ncbi:hypothetical protein ACJZ2D_014918 [Fusarium nematophilum]
MKNAEIPDGRVTTSQSASLKLPLSLPWIPSSTPIQPGTTFHSRLANSEDPWSKILPFDKSQLKDITLKYRNDDGGVASYRSTESESSTSSSEHLGVALGITVGCKWLGASVTGGFDKDTLENHDARKISTVASFRAGSILLEQRPRLSREALLVLKHHGGLPAFNKLFGDYYVAGYRLGGDAGVLVSESKSSRSTNERLFVKAGARALFADASKTHEKFFSKGRVDSSYRVHGFDTLDHLRIPASAPVTIESGLPGLVDKAKDLENRCIKLAERVTARVEETGLKQGEVLDSGVLERLLKSNVLVDIILLPMSTLREVKEWSISSCAENTD